MAFDFAAPDELAVTPLHSPDLLGVVAPSTAQQVAAVRTRRRPVALPARCPDDAPVGVRAAVVRGSLHVDQLVGLDGDATHPPVLAPESGSLLGSHHDLDAGSVAVLDQVADLPEARHRLPARLHRARG